GAGGHVAGAGDEHHVGVVLSGVQHIGLVAVGVGEDDVAALLRQVHSRVVTILVLGDVVAEDHLGVGGVVGVGRDAQLLAGGGEAADVGFIVAGVDVVDADQTDLHGFGGDAGGLLAAAVNAALVVALCVVPCGGIVTA